MNDNPIEVGQIIYLFLGPFICNFIFEDTVAVTGLEVFDLGNEIYESIYERIRVLVEFKEISRYHLPEQ